VLIALRVMVAAWMIRAVVRNRRARDEAASGSLGPGWLRSTSARRSSRRECHVAPPARDQ